MVGVLITGQKVLHALKIILRPIILALLIFTLNNQQPLGAEGCSKIVIGAFSCNVEKTVGTSIFLICFHKVYF